MRQGMWRVRGRGAAWGKECASAMRHDKWDRQTMLISRGSGGFWRFNTWARNWKPAWVFADKQCLYSHMQTVPRARHSQAGQTVKWYIRHSKSLNWYTSWMIGGYWHRHWTGWNTCVLRFTYGQRFCPCARECIIVFSFVLCSWKEYWWLSWM